MSKLIKQLNVTKQASRILSETSTEKRKQIILDISDAILSNTEIILKANAKDIKNFKGSLPLCERLELNKEKITQIVKSLKKVAVYTDYVGKILETKKLANGLILKKISVPLGVVAVIYESRPNVTVDLAALAIKSGNAVVLKGGKESFETNKVLVQIMKKVLIKHGLSDELLLLLDSKSEWKKTLLTARGLIDVVIPRGGKGLIDFVRDNATIPMIETGAGVCHTFVDEDYDVNNAVQIIINAKTQRPAVCNSLDTLVVHKTILEKLLKKLSDGLVKYNVEILADVHAYKILQSIYPKHLLKHSHSTDYGYEFLALKLAIKTVEDFKEGMDFVQMHTSGHSEAILTNNTDHANQFCNYIDAAVVYVNASTRFTDGGEFGLGAEVGVSTQKLHARGPMGIEALTTYKWVATGSGQVRK